MSNFVRLKCWPVTHRFIETGTHLGPSVRVALQEGYRRVDSIDIDEDVVANCSRLFAAEDRAAIHLGSSPIALRKIIDPNILTTFWLDAHYSGVRLPSHDPIFGQCPLLAELEAIMAAPWKELPYIAIDDAFMFTDEAWTGKRPDVCWDSASEFDRRQWPSIEEIQARLPGYSFYYDSVRFYCTPAHHFLHREGGMP